MLFNKKTIALSALLIFVAILATGCGNKTQDPEMVADSTLNPDIEVSPVAEVPDTPLGSVDVDPSAQSGQTDTAQTTEPKPDPGPDRKFAPNVTLTAISGKSHSLSDFRGKVVLLDFWATWCGPCKAEIPHLVKLYNKYKGQGLVIIGIGLDKQSKLADYVKKNGVTYITLVDEKSESARAYKVNGIPRTLMIDKKGRIAFDHTGFSPGMETQMEAEITQLLAEEY